MLCTGCLGFALAETVYITGCARLRVCVCVCVCVCMCVCVCVYTGSVRLPRASHRPHTDMSTRSQCSSCAVRTDAGHSQQAAGHTATDCLPVRAHTHTHTHRLLLYLARTHVRHVVMRPCPLWELSQPTWPTLLHPAACTTTSAQTHTCAPVGPCLHSVVNVSAYTSSPCRL